MSQLLASIHPVMRKYGVTCTPEEFHAAVNLVFHKIESSVYDRIHRRMWDGLPEQFELLISDFMHTAALPKRSRVLDIGCGTGLASEMLLRSAIGASIHEIDLLDTSPEMLALARARASSWQVETHFYNGTLEVLQRENRYDLIVACSVLHHIPDVEGLLLDVQSLQASRGIFLHLQDTNGDYLDDPILKQRTAALERAKWPFGSRFLHEADPRPVLQALYRTVTRRRDYLDEINEVLIHLRLIRRPMVPIDLWTVTDLHVHDGEGISINAMGHCMRDYTLISHRSYGFYGVMPSDLPPALRAEERQLTCNGALNGHQVSGLWMLNG
jgi:ubiquinone/menaquinone biosynthesis C-methylase UbiE